VSGLFFLVSLGLWKNQIMLWVTGEWEDYLFCSRKREVLSQFSRCTKRLRELKVHFSSRSLFVHLLWISVWKAFSMRFDPKNLGVTALSVTLMAFRLLSLETGLKCCNDSVNLHLMNSCMARNGLASRLSHLLIRQMKIDKV
jgi:hypothetical protein